FLSEFLYWWDVDRWAAAHIPTLQIHETATEIRLQAQAQGGRAPRAEKAIKAVTYHGLQILETEHGYRALLIFDV
ncbi:MAG: archease, partial [Chloroflexi bacterium]|nr:archease [Chloroflexota bacterium]